MNEIIHYFQIENVREMNNLLKAAANVRSKLVGCKRKTKGKKQKKPWWKRRLESQMEDMRKDLGILECTKKEKNRKSKITEKKYHIKSRGVVVVIEELKQRVIAKSAKKKSYEIRTDQFNQNRLCQNNQNKLFGKIDGIDKESDEITNAEEAKMF